MSISKLFKGLELETDTIDKLNNIIDENFILKEEHNKLIGEKMSIKENEMKELQSEYDKQLLDKDNEFISYKQNVEEKERLQANESVLRRKLLDIGANDSVVDLLMKEFDISSLELDGSEIKDWDKIGTPIKEQYKDLFSETSTEGVSIAEPPMNIGVNDLFLEGFDQE